MSQWFESQRISGGQIVAAILLLQMVPGIIFEGFAILVPTVPLIQPVLETLGNDMIPFGVLIAIVPNLALYSPPVDINGF